MVGVKIYSEPKFPLICTNVRVVRLAAKKTKNRGWLVGFRLVDSQCRGPMRGFLLRAGAVAVLLAVVGAVAGPKPRDLLDDLSEGASLLELLS